MKEYIKVTHAPLLREGSRPPASLCEVLPAASFTSAGPPQKAAAFRVRWVCRTPQPLRRQSCGWSWMVF